MHPAGPQFSSVASAFATPWAVARPSRWPAHQDPFPFNSGLELRGLRYPERFPWAALAAWLQLDARLSQWSLPSVRVCDARILVLVSGPPRPPYPLSHSGSTPQHRPAASAPRVAVLSVSADAGPPLELLSAALDGARFVCGLGPSCPSC